MKLVPSGAFSVAVCAHQFLKGRGSRIRKDSIGSAEIVSLE